VISLLESGLCLWQRLGVAFGLKNELATTWSGNAEINNTVACKKPSDDRLHGQILPNQ
jgi:hypothetical protein